MTPLHRDERSAPTSLGLKVSAHACANGETVEWRLYAGDSIIESIYVRHDDLDSREATRWLLKKAMR